MRNAEQLASRGFTFMMSDYGGRLGFVVDHEREGLASLCTYTTYQWGFRLYLTKSNTCFVKKKGVAGDHFLIWTYGGWLNTNHSSGGMSNMSSDLTLWRVARARLWL